MQIRFNISCAQQTIHQMAKFYLLSKNKTNILECHLLQFLMAFEWLIIISLNTKAENDRNQFCKRRQLSQTVSLFKISYIYGKCPKFSYDKVSDKMAYANSADPDQTAPKGAVWSGSVYHSTKYCKKSA